VRALTRAEARAAIVNVDPAEGKVRLPGHFDDLRWEELDYLGWRDPRAPSRAFLVADVDGRAVGALLRQSPSHAEVGSRAVMCALCRFSRRFNEVALFAAHRPSRDPRKRLSSVGLLLCTDLDCHRNVRTVRSGGPIDPPPDEVVRARREGLRARTVAFLHTLTDGAPPARTRSR